MPNYFDAVNHVTGPLTLAAFLAVVVLALYRRSVKDEKGLEYLYSLLRDRMSKKDFYRLSARVITYAFITVLTLFALSLLAWAFGKWVDASARRAEGQELTSRMYKAEETEQIRLREDSRRVKESAAELANVLRLNASKVLEEMELRRRELLAANARGLHSKRLRVLKKVQEQFVELHRLHVEAVSEGRLVEAHEILDRIHYLLLVYQADTCPPPCGMYPGAKYRLPDPLVVSAMMYPGEKPEIVNDPYLNLDCLISDIWRPEYENEYRTDLSRFRSVEKEFGGLRPD